MGSRMQSTHPRRPTRFSSLYTLNYTKLRWCAASIRALNLLATEFSDSIERGKTRIRYVVTKYFVIFLRISTHCGALPSTTTSPTTPYISPHSFTHFIGDTLK